MLIYRNSLKIKYLLNIKKDYKMKNFISKYEIKKHFKNYGMLSIKPVIIGILAVVVWSRYFCEEYRARPEDSEVITAVLGMFLFFSTFIVVMTITWTSKQFSRMRSAVNSYYENSNEEKKKEKYKKFKKNLTKKIPTILNFVIFIAVILAIMASMLLPYHRYDVGIFCVFGVTFLHSLCFFVAMELDDPTKRPWLLKVPDEWLEQLRLVNESDKPFLMNKNGEGDDKQQSENKIWDRENIPE